MDNDAGIVIFLEQDRFLKRLLLSKENIHTRALLQHSLAAVPVSKKPLNGGDRSGKSTK